jgi:hypothetical protein
MPGAMGADPTRLAPWRDRRRLARRVAVSDAASPSVRRLCRIRQARVADMPGPSGAQSLQRAGLHRVRRRQDDDRAARPPHPSLPHSRNRNRQLPFQEQLGESCQTRKGEISELDERLIPKPSSSRVSSQWKSRVSSQRKSTTEAPQSVPHVQGRVTWRPVCCTRFHRRLSGPSRASSVISLARPTPGCRLDRN